MGKWHFVESDADGELWLSHPNQMHAFIDVEQPGHNGPRRLMVVTKSWMDAQLATVQRGPAGPGYTVFAPMLVIPDGSPSDLRAAIELAVGNPGLAYFGEKPG